jgi:hypothetical protein
VVKWSEVEGNTYDMLQSITMAFAWKVGRKLCVINLLTKQAMLGPKFKPDTS